MRPIKYRPILGQWNGFSMKLHIQAECPVCRSVNTIETYSLELSVARIKEPKQGLKWLVTIASSERHCNECGVASVFTSLHQHLLAESLYEVFTSDILMDFVQKSGAVAKIGHAQTPYDSIVSYNTFTGGKAFQGEWVEIGNTP